MHKTDDPLQSSRKDPPATVPPRKPILSILSFLLAPMLGIITYALLYRDLQHFLSEPLNRSLSLSAWWGTPNMIMNAFLFACFGSGIAVILGMLSKRRGERWRQFTSVVILINLLASGLGLYEFGPYFYRREFAPLADEGEFTPLSPVHQIRTIQEAR